MTYLTFCKKYNYNQRHDMAVESYDVFNRFFYLISNNKHNSSLLSFVGLKGYA